MKPKKIHMFRRPAVLLLMALLVFFVVFTIYFQLDTRLSPPENLESELVEIQRQQLDQNLFVLQSNALRLNEYGLWEMYLEGNPYSIGLANGKLTQHLIQIQEDTFVEKIKQMVPAQWHLRFLKYFIAWFTRDIDEHIPLEYQQEIYGVSKSAAEGYEYIGNKYNRILNYHAAHDIGHALQDLALVGCTSFATHMNEDDDQMIIGRNFDFYVSDGFAENKIVVFVKPESGHDFMYVSWASMIGVVSGMNMEGLSITLNAAKSDIPYKAATPISILAREILQYASNIEEAVQIAESRQSFVSESLLIGSARDNRAVIIEKSVSKTAVFETDASSLVCSNHFQSEVFLNDAVNQTHRFESASDYRQRRCEELIAASDSIPTEKAIAILRDRYGLENQDIGMGNEKAMCQLISHHGIVFEPEKRWVWVSTNDYQLGSFIKYDLAKVFRSPQALADDYPLYDTTVSVAADPFISSPAYKDFKLFRSMQKTIKKHIADASKLPEETAFIDQLISSNPNYYRTHLLAGEYYYAQDKLEKAVRYLKASLDKEYEKQSERRRTEELIESIEKGNPL